MIRVIAVDGPPLAHCYTAVVIVERTGQDGSRFGEYERGQFIPMPSHEVDQMLAEYRIFAVDPPIQIDEPAGEPLYAIVATGKLLSSAGVSADGWARLMAPLEVLQGPGINAVDPPDREWRVRTGTEEQIREWCAKWYNTLSDQAHAKIRAYLEKRLAADIEAGVQLAQLANEAGWQDERRARDASVTLALAFKHHKPQRSARVHTFMSFRFPDWTWEQFRTEMDRLEYMLQPSRDATAPRRKCPATASPRLRPFVRGSSPRLAYFGAGR